MIRTRAARLLVVCLLILTTVGSALAQRAAAPRPPAARPGAASASVRDGGTIAAIKVDGNQRIETGTILSYMLVQQGDPFDPDRLDRSLKTLYATGLFQDVQINREGDTLVVHVIENPLVNRVAFGGKYARNGPSTFTSICGVCVSLSTFSGRRRRPSYLPPASWNWSHAARSRAVLLTAPAPPAWSISSHLIAEMDLSKP